MTEKIILSIEQRKEKARNFLKDNGENPASFATWFSQSGTLVYAEQPDQVAFEWNQEGEYFVHLAFKGAGTLIKLEAPNGVTKELPIFQGNSGRSPVEAVLGALLEVDTKDKTIGIVTPLEWVCTCIESLEKWEANDWIKADKKPPNNLDVWKLVSSELKTKNILLYAAKTKGGILKLTTPKPAKITPKRKSKAIPESTQTPFIVDSFPAEWGEVSGGLYAI